MNQYRLQIAHQTSELTVMIAEKLTINSTPSDKIFWCSTYLNTEAIIIKDSTGIRAFNTSGNSLDLEKLAGIIEQLRDYM